MNKLPILGGLLLSLAAVPAMAQETAYTTSTTNVEAGPAPDYPVVGSFGAGTPVTLYGCVGGYSWCDVSYGDARGWVDGSQLAYPYQDQRVPIAVYGPELNLTVVSFSFGSYWDEHYRGRPFYAERARFEHHAPPPAVHRGPPPPLPARAGGPGPHPEGRPEARPGEPHPGEPHPAPVAARPEAARPEPPARPEARPEARPVEPTAHVDVPHPQPAPRPVEAPRPAAAPAERPAAPHPAEQHPGEHPEGEQPH